jgi:hypothetical protein
MRSVPTTAVRPEAPPAEPRARTTAPPQPVDATPPAPPPRPAAPARDISLRIGGGEQQVEVRVVERGGAVHVAVRASETELARTLRQDLPELSTRLEREGLRAEDWHPSVAALNRSDPAPGDGRGGASPQPGQPGGQDRHEERRQAPQPHEVRDSDAETSEPEDFAWLLSSTA